MRASRSAASPRRSARRRRSASISPTSSAPRAGLVGSYFGEGAGPGLFFDLQNVQVLKGPQGTLFGRNTTGGAVLLVPQRPTDHFEGYVEGTIGNLDLRRLQGVINVPVSESIRLRFGADYEKRDGYLKNISRLGPSRFGDRDRYALRGSVLIDVTPDIENYTDRLLPALQGQWRHPEGDRSAMPDPATGRSFRGNGRACLRADRAPGRKRASTPFRTPSPMR